MKAVPILQTYLPSSRTSCATASSCRKTSDTQRARLPETRASMKIHPHSENPARAGTGTRIRRALSA